MAATHDDRVTALEARIVQLEARIAQLERTTYNIPQPTTPWIPAVPLPSPPPWAPPFTVTCSTEQARAAAGY